MNTKQPSDLIVEVFAVAVSELVALGLSREEAVLGLLSQAAVQATLELWYMLLFYTRNFILIL